MIKIILFFIVVVNTFSLTVYDPTNYIQNYQSAIEAVKQTKTQADQLKSQIQMIKNLSEEVSNGNISKIDRVFRELEISMTQYKSLIFDSENLTKKYWTLLNKDSDDFINNMGFGEEYLKEIDRRNKEARRLSDNALYDVMTQSGFSAKLGADQQNIQTLLNASKTSDGVLEAIQVTNSILGQMSESLLKLGIVTETSVKAEAMSKSTESGELQNAQKKLKDVTEATDEKNKQIMEEMLIKSNRKTTI
ncbi:MAG: hypothetical protein ACRDB9_08520 [Cetobacterium sp.]